jgi:hypothetical protein
MLERNYTGGAGELYASEAAQDKYNVWGNEQNNFWLERLYMTFPLLGGTMNVGRMSGGNWANDFGDLDQNRDRILYLRKFGPFTVGGLIEKLGESDGGLEAPRWNNLVNSSFSTVDQDVDAYALLAVMPFSKNIILRPLYYHIRYGNGAALGSTEPVNYHVFMLGGIYKFGPVSFEHEIDYRMRTIKTASHDIDYHSLQIWAGLGLNFGPLSVDVDGFWIQGGDHSADSKDRTFSAGTGNRFQPLLLSFSEDMGLFYASGGVTNGSKVGETSGYLCFYAPVSFKISDDMKVGGVLGWLRADKMQEGSAHDGTRANKDLGWEVDVNFTWRFMDNISYIMDAGYFFTGNYWKEATGLKDQDVYGIRNTIRVEW